MKMLGGIFGWLKRLEARCFRDFKRTASVLLGLVLIGLLLIFVWQKLFDDSSDALLSWVEPSGTKGELTRAEFHILMGERLSQVLQDKNAQKNHLDSLLFTRLQAFEAVAKELNLEPEYIQQTNRIFKDNLLISELLETLFPRDRLEFSHQARLTRLILIERDQYNHISEPDPNRFKRMEQIQTTITNPERLAQEMEKLQNATITRHVRKTAEELEAHESEILERAQEVLAEVKAEGADFIEIAKEKSDHSSAEEGGWLGYILPRSQSYSPLLIRAIAQLKEGETTELINTLDGYVIAKVEKIVSVKPGNLEKFYPDEAKVNHAKNDAWFASVWALIDGTIEDERGKTIFVYPENLTSTNTNDLLFEIRDSRVEFSYTRGDLIRAIDNISPPRRERYGMLKGTNRPESFSADEVFNYFEWECSYPVLRLACWKSGIVESKRFKLKFAQKSWEVLASRLGQRRQDECVVSDEEIAEHYESTKASYQDEDDYGNPIQMSLEDATPMIRHELRRKKINDSFEDWKNELYTLYQAKIHEGSLKVKAAPAKVEAKKN